MGTLVIPTNAVEFCKMVEAQLGWVPPNAPEYLRYRVMAGRVKAKMAEAGIGFEELAYAVALCRQEKKPRNPLGVFSYVERAQEMARLPETDLEGQVRSAIAYERLRGDPMGWATRLTRAQGVFRQQVLDEWRVSAR